MSLATCMTHLAEASIERFSQYGSTCAAITLTWLASSGYLSQMW
jgi:hypothetical protein